MIREALKRGRARIVIGSQGPEYGDASACLKLRTPVIRRDLHEHVFKMRAPSVSAKLRRKSLDELSGRHLQGAGQ